MEVIGGYRYYTSEEQNKWCKAHGYQPTDSITVRTFIEQTKNDYGSDAIRMLAERYAIKFDN